MSLLSKVHNDGLVIQIKELLDEYPEIRYYDMDRINYPSKKPNNKSTYTVCTGCEKTSVQITTQGHDKQCLWMKSKRKFDKLYSGLNRFERENLDYILQELTNN